MHLRLTDTGILTITVIIITLWFGIFRSSLPDEDNWPVIFWAGMITFSYFTTDIVNPLVIYAGTALTLMIRFEFLSHGIVHFIYALEWVFFTYIIMRGLGYVLL